MKIFQQKSSNLQYTNSTYAAFDCMRTVAIFKHSEVKN